MLQPFNGRPGFRIGFIVGCRWMMLIGILQHFGRIDRDSQTANIPDSGRIVSLLLPATNEDPREQNGEGSHPR